ncbi:hypothetical protein Poli38472_011876 [Pythium oligandrum]|uniref:Uncharacterized protein n=1 Tax=Pythium oligandrum TaxID=41045 RepID=A0A8K1FH07_PYTOL|nr:hypothetical protein Poli38472_011876 [Pythium oligandrum]|eukprot:TMW58288.1 hypothetical protein Poli38472_011876 [Pythium oligandrum]
MVESQLRIIQSMIVFITKGEVNEIPTCSAVHYQQLCLNANALDDHVFAVKNDFVPVICDPRFLLVTMSVPLKTKMPVTVVRQSAMDTTTVHPMDTPTRAQKKQIKDLVTKMVYKLEGWFPSLTNFLSWEKELDNLGPLVPEW